MRSQIRLKQTDYISVVLESVLDDANISYSFIPIKKIWNGEKYLYDDKIPCVVFLSTTFMWNTWMISVVIEWIYNNLNCRKLIIGGQYGVLKCDYIKKYV